MSRSRALPEDQDPHIRHLVVELRSLKDRGGLTVAQIAARTGYSRASWERYFTGRNLPPREAVEALARACGADAARVLALHEVAADARSAARTAEPAPGAAQRTESTATQSRRRRGPWIAGALGALAIATVVTLWAVHPWQHPAPSAAPHYTCRLTRADGQWYAGLSRTRTDIVQEGMAGPEVAEVQCLLQRAGFSPGGIDGIYGSLTQRAVRRLQAGHGLVTDGVVGPHTWGALRG